MGLLPRPPRPTEHERDVLRAAVLPDAAGLASWSRVRDGLDIDALTPSEYELVPRLAANLERIDPRYGDLPRLRGYRRHTWTTNQVVLAGLAAAATVLEASGIPIAVFGSAATAVAFDREPALRRIHAPQVLVRRTALTSAHRAFAHAGDDVGELEPPGPDAVHRCFTVRRNDVAVIVAGVPAPALGWPGPAGEPPAFWSHTSRVEIAGRDLVVVGPESALVIECVDALGGHGPVRLAALADIHTIAAHDELDWDRVVECAREQHATGLVRDALALASEILGSPVPPRTVQTLTDVPRSLRDRVVHRLHELPGFTVPVLGGALDSAGRAVAATAPLPAHEAVPASVRMLGAHWGITSWRSAPSALVRKARGAGRPGRPAR